MTCALIKMWQIVKGSKIKKQQPNNKAVYHNNKSKAPALTDCETKALHVYKVQDCFWFDINQLVYIGDAKACAECMLQSISNREVGQWMCLPPFSCLKTKEKKKASTTEKA